MEDKGKLTVLIGGQYGSEGKGAIAAYLADSYDIHVRVGSPNAGHTIYWAGEKHVMQSIPCGWINPNAKIVIGRGALLNMKQFMKELVHIMQYYPHFMERLFIDPEAGVLDEKFKEEEGGVYGEMHKRIGSTGEGVGPARVARINRDPKIFRRFKEIADDYDLSKCMYENTPKLVAEYKNSGSNVLIEGTQGSGLSLLHSHYPYCTSIDTNASGIISEVGVSPLSVTDILMICRTYPIRVAGNSGPMKNEITWDELNKRIMKAGGKGVKSERTTVTHKIRRIAEWDDDLFDQSVILNAPTEIALTFADYIDPSLYGTDSTKDVNNSVELQKFLKSHNLKNKVRYIGTGPQTVVDLKEGRNE